MASITRDIFKAYDIRGIVGKTLTDDAAYFIGRVSPPKPPKKVSPASRSDATDA